MPIGGRDLVLLSDSQTEAQVRVCQVFVVVCYKLVDVMMVAITRTFQVAELRCTSLAGSSSIGMLSATLTMVACTLNQEPIHRPFVAYR